MYELMASCFAWLKRKKEPERSITLVIIGLDDAGKTTTIAGIQGEPPDGITPTVGFANKSLKINGRQVTAYDLGGGAKFRAVWKQYYAEVYGIVFVVDSSNKGRLEECKTVLHEVIEHSRIAGKPILILANKQDKEGALNLEAIESLLELKQMAEKLNFQFSLMGCSAIKGYGRKLDPKIKQGLQWLLTCILNEMSKLAPRIDQDVALQKEEAQKEKQARMERVRKIREERERREREAGILPEEESDEDVVASGNVNPFQPLKKHLENVETKKQKQKQEKAKEMEVKGQNNGDIIAETPEANTPVERKKKKKKKKKVIKEAASPETADYPAMEEGQEIQETVKKKKKKKKKKILNENDNPTLNDLGVNNEVVYVGEENRSPKKKVKSTKDTLGSAVLVRTNDDDIMEESYINGGVGLTTPRQMDRTELSDDHTVLDHPSDAHFKMTASPLKTKKKKVKIKSNLSEEENEDHLRDEPIKKTKTKKKKVKRNRTAPAPEEPTVLDLPPPLPPPAWKTPPGTLNRLPALAPLRSELNNAPFPPSLGSIRAFGERDAGLVSSFHATPNGDDNDVIT